MKKLVLILALGSLLLVGTALWAATTTASFPFNGTFDLGNGEPLGWRLAGAWEVKSQAACHGKAGLWLPAASAKAGDQLQTAGYLLADPGESLRVRLTYICAGGHLRVGLVPCDLLGARKGTPLIEELPPCGSWTQVEKTLAFPVDVLPREVASVRLMLGVDQDGTEVKLDDVSLTPLKPRPLLTAPALPKLDPLKSGNLLPALDPKYTAAGGAGGWYALDWQGYSAKRAQLERAATGKGYQFALTGSDSAAGWVSRRLALDVSLPYSVRATVSGQSLTGGQLVLLARVLDPRDPTTVWLQTHQRVTVRGPADTVTLSLPRLYADKRAGLAQVGVLLEAGATGTATVSALSLQPEPVSLAVRSAARSKPGPENVSLFVSAVNNTATVLKPQALLATVDSTGRTVHQEKRDIVMGPRSAAYFPYKPKLPAAGDYRMTARVVTKTGELGTTSFGFHVKQAEMLGGMTEWGALQVSSGYLLVKPEDRLKLSLLYCGNRGGNAAALLLCDAFGRQLDKQAVLALPEGQEALWQPFAQEFSLADYLAPTGVVSAVRLLSRQPQPEAGEDLDALTVCDLTQEPQPATVKTPPSIVLAQRANLLPPVTGAVEGAERVGAWAPLAAPGLAPEQATAARDADTNQVTFKLTGGEKLGAWATAPLPLDGALPYVFTVTVNSADLSAGGGLVLLRLLDPADQAAVLWQTSLAVAPSATPQALSLALPRQTATRGLVLAQVVIAAEAGSTGSLSFTNPALRPEPLTVSVRRGIQGAGCIDPLSPQVFVSAVNNGEDDLRPTAILTARNAEGKVGYEEKRAIVIGARSAAHFPFKLNLPAAGAYVIEVRVEADGREIGRGSMPLNTAD